MDIVPAVDQLFPDSHLIHESLHFEIMKALNTLTERESEVIRLYFGLGHYRPHNLEEISQKFHLTKERIRQIKEKAIKKLQHISHSGILKEYLG